MRIAVAKNAPEDIAASNRAGESLIDSVEVTLEAYLGKSSLKISELRELKPDATITLDASLGSAVELRLNGRTIARGELVSVGDRFGVRLTEIGQ